MVLFFTIKLYTGASNKLLFVSTVTQYFYYPSNRFRLAKSSSLVVHILQILEKQCATYIHFCVTRKR